MKLKDELKEKWPLILMIVSLALFLFAGIQLLLYYSDFRRESELDGRLQGIRSKILAEEVDAERTDTEEAVKERAQHIMAELAAINPDYMGWLTLEGTEISYPVVQRDNDYYLDHDFEGNVNRHGAIFLDGGCDADFAVWLIHGHHMKDGTMFGSLKNMEKVSYLQEHTTLYFDAGDGDEEYRIYAAALIDFANENETFRSFHYEQLPQTTEEFKQWQSHLERYSYWYDTGFVERLEELSTGLQPREILILSTCEYGTELQRLIVVAVRAEE